MFVKCYRPISILTIALFQCIALGAVEQKCVNWFGQSKIKAADKHCVSTCASLRVDLGTFVCTDRCDELCREESSCDSYRTKLFRSFTDAAPIKWDMRAEKVKNWTADEKAKVVDAILKLPQKLVLKGSFKLHN